MPKPPDPPPMHEEEAVVRARIESLTAHDFDPVLNPADIDDLMVIAKRQDENGNNPDDPEWEPTWAVRAAVRQGWEIKAARASAGFRFEEDNQGFYREQVYRACREMADRYKSQMVAVEVVSAQDF